MPRRRSSGCCRWSAAFGWRAPGRGCGTYGELPLQMFEEIGDLYHRGRFCVNVAIGFYYEGEWVRAAQMYRQSLELAERTGDVFSVAVAQMNIGEVLANQGQLAEAIELLTRSVDGLRVLSTPLAAAHAACFLGAALRLAGRHEAAHEQLDEARRLFAEAGRSSGFSLDELATRELELAVDEGHDGAVARATELLERDGPLADIHRARVHRSRALAHIAADDRRSADDDLRASLRLARELPLGYEAALTLLAAAGPDPDPDSGTGSARDEAAAILAALGASPVLADLDLLPS